MLSPVLQVNDGKKTWRDKIIANDVNAFFNGVAGGYRYFIIHYVDLCLKNNIKIDGFAIGNELKGITDPLHSYSGDLPFVTLAKDVKQYFTNGKIAGKTIYCQSKC